MQESPPHKAVLSLGCSPPFMRLAGHLHGASRLVQAMSASSVNTRRSPSRQCRDASVTVMRIRSCMAMSTSPLPRVYRVYLQSSSPRRKLTLKRIAPCSDTIFSAPTRRYRHGGGRKSGKDNTAFLFLFFFFSFHAPPLCVYRIYLHSHTPPRQYTLKLITVFRHNLFSTSEAFSIRWIGRKRGE